MLKLKPSNIFYSQHQISAPFGKWNRHRHTSIGETLDDLCDGICKVTSIEPIKVVKKDGKWVTIDNRRLWVFHHLEGAGKCETIPVEEVQYSPFDHGRKFSSTNGGISVSFIRGRSPGGKWYRRITPVTPRQETQTKKTESSVENVVQSQHKIKFDKEENSVSKYSSVTSEPVSKVLKDIVQPVSSLETARKDKRDPPWLTKLNFGRIFSLFNKIHTNKTGVIDESSTVNGKEDTISKLNTQSFGSLIANTSRNETKFHSNVHRYKELTTLQKALHRHLYKPYNFGRTRSNRLHTIRVNYGNHAKHRRHMSDRRKRITWFMNGWVSDISDSSSSENSEDENSDDQDIESEYDWLDQEFSMLVDERVQSDNEEPEMSASDDDCKEIDYDDDPWSDANDADDETVHDDNDDDDKEKEDDVDDDEDDDDDDCVGLTASGGDSDSVKNNKDENTEDVTSYTDNLSTEKENDEEALDKNGQNDIPVDLRSDLEYDELDVWPNEFDEISKYKTFPDSGSSDSQDDFLVAKEVEISERRMDKFLENSRRDSLSDESTDEDEESLALNVHYTYADRVAGRKNLHKEIWV